MEGEVNIGETEAEIEFKRAKAMTKCAYKWAGEMILGMHPEIESDRDTVAEYFRQCLEDWVGEKRQQPKDLNTHDLIKEYEEMFK
jgi:hypothetical protein